MTRTERRQISEPEIAKKVKNATDLNLDDFKISKTVEAAFIPYKECSKVLKSFKV